LVELRREERAYRRRTHLTIPLIANPA
jgi:hypothetical protein